MSTQYITHLGLVEVLRMDLHLSHLEDPGRVFWVVVQRFLGVVQPLLAGYYWLVVALYSLMTQEMNSAENIQK